MPVLLVLLCLFRVGGLQQKDAGMCVRVLDWNVKLQKWSGG